MSGLTAEPPTAAGDRDRDETGRPLSARPRDRLGRPAARADQSGTPAAGSAHPEPARSPAETLQHAQALLDTGEPFAAHEVFEMMWKATDGPTRALWRGLAQLAVGITHAARGNESGARALLSRAAETLSPLAGTTPYEVAVDAVRAWASEAADNLAIAAHPPRLCG